MIKKWGVVQNQWSLLPVSLLWKSANVIELLVFIDYLCKND